MHNPYSSFTHTDAGVTLFPTNAYDMVILFGNWLKGGAYIHFENPILQQH